jgi:hypothetical protein
MATQRRRDLRPAACPPWDTHQGEEGDAPDAPLGGSPAGPAAGCAAVPSPAGAASPAFAPAGPRPTDCGGTAPPAWPRASILPINLCHPSSPAAHDHPALLLRGPPFTVPAAVALRRADRTAKTAPPAGAWGSRPLPHEAGANTRRACWPSGSGPGSG